MSTRARRTDLAGELPAPTRPRKGKVGPTGQRP
jgi:hypothetical protein